MLTNQKSLTTLSRIIDSVLIYLSFLIAAILAQPIHVLYEREYILSLAILLNLLWLFTSVVTSFYSDFSFKSFSAHFIIIIKNVTIQALFSIAFIFTIKEDLFTRYFIIFYSALLALFVSVRVLSMKFILSALSRKGKNLRKSIVIGHGELALSVIEILNSKSELGYEYIGFICNSEFANNEKFLGKLNDLETIIANNHIDDIIVNLQDFTQDEIRSIIRLADKNAIRTHLLPNFTQFISRKFQMNFMGDVPVITSRGEPLAEFQWRFLKRTFDLIVSIIVLILVLTWLMPILILMQLLFSKGPVFFIQDRVGIKGKLFRCYKFRTMYLHEQKEKFSPTLQNDPRVTPFGKIMRKFNLDELPQFFNVIKGDMSLVGPRPHAVNFEETYEKYVEEIKLRQLIRPGLTGWAQVHGLRGDVKEEELNRQRTKKRVEYDIWYMENWTFWLDIQIILMTVWQMISGRTKAI